jgi:Periplasmic binding protein
LTHTRARAVLLAFLLLASAACARDDGGASAEDDGGEAPTDDGGSDGGGEATSLEAGGFGDLEAVCQEGDASGATAPGVTDDAITVGTITDKGGPVQGLNEEMYDTAVAFTEWCNEHGGILGRELVLSDVDAKLFDYEPAMTDSCGRDFALVGGGAVFDEEPNDVRVTCEQPNIAGYVVSARGRTADLQVQPVPNAIYDVAMGRYNAAARNFPDSGDKYGIMASAIPSVLLVKQQSIEVAEASGFEVAYSYDYQSQGETGWANFVREMKDKDIKILEFIGQPQNLIELTDEMAIADWHPEAILLSTNFYDELYREGATTDSNLYIQSGYYPLELADENKATQDYLDLMEQYNPDGKVAQLGMQGLSSWLLFAQAASACGSELTAECLLAEAAAPEEWSAGGLHAPQSPGSGQPSPCFLILGLDEEGFFYNEEATAPTDDDGLYNCDEENLFHLTGDYSEYGAPPPEG